MQFTEAKFGRVFVLRLHDGDHLPDVLESFAKEKNVSSALCFLIGGVKEKGRVVVGPRNGEAFPPEPVVTLLSGVHEVCGVGTIFINGEGKPKLHMHASFGRGKKTVTGCVRMGIVVWQIGEVVMLELTSSSAQRAKDEKTGFEFLEIQKNPR
ncbi:MAG TPA: PPC domain-containing DNA-binding protein [Candidatus Bathyarchaeia archaeon]|nr:PPC domain-containing DNA-binding protein [Candidatus Bathyarchaeia archaeon]